jgi:DNA-binding SARP family transcriptional activator
MLTSSLDAQAVREGLSVRSRNVRAFALAYRQSGQAFPRKLPSFFRHFASRRGWKAMLQIQLFGTVSITYHGEKITLRPKPLALLLFVMLNRQVDTATLDEHIAVPSSKNWYDIRETLGALKELVSAKYHDPIAFLPPQNFWCDVQAFMHRTENIPAQKTAALLEAFDLYGGELKIRKSPYTTDKFHEWIDALSQRLTRRYLEVCDRLEKDYVAQRDAEKLLYVIDRMKNPSQRRQKEHRILRLRLLGILGRYEEAEQAARQMERIAFPEEQAQLEAVRQKISQHDQHPNLGSELWQEIIRSDLHCPTPSKPDVLRREKNDRYVGRPELEQLRQAVEQPRQNNPLPRIIVVVGMGGVGKSTLVRQLAMQDGDRLFHNGVLWGNLDGSSDETSILRDWISRLSQGNNPSVTLEERLRDLTTACTRLIVIEDDGIYERRQVSAGDDDDDQPAPKVYLLPKDTEKVVAKIRRLLPVGGGNTVIITTRNWAIFDHLQQSEAEVVPVQIRTVDETVGMNIVRKYAGTLLLPEESRALVKTLEGLPLALEMAATYIWQALGKEKDGTRVAEYLRRFEEKRSQLGDLLPKVDVTLDVSRDLLSKRLRDLFDELAVFGTRPFDARAAAAVWDCDLDTAETNLAKLVTLSLVQAEDQRCRLHAIVARFALEYLEDSDRYEATRRRMLNYYLALPQLDTPVPVLLPERLALEYCLDQAFEDGLYLDFMSCVERSHRLWTSQGFYTRARDLYFKASQAAAALDDLPRQAYFLALASETLLEQGGADEYAQAAAWIADAESLLTEADLTAQFYVQRAKVRWALETQDESVSMREELAKLDTIMEGLSDRASADLQIAYMEARAWSVSQMFYEGRQNEEKVVDDLLTLTSELLEQLSTFQDSYLRNINVVRCLARQNGLLIWALERYPNAPVWMEANYQRARQLCQVLNEYAELSPLLNYYVIFAIITRQFNRGLYFALECEQINRQVGDRKGLARTLRSQSRLYEMIEAWEEAYKKTQECASMLEMYGLQTSEADLYVEALVASGRYAANICWFDKAIAAWEKAYHFRLVPPPEYPDQRTLIEKRLEIVRAAQDGDIDLALYLNSQLEANKRLKLDCLDSDGEKV